MEGVLPLQSCGEVCEEEPWERFGHDIRQLILGWDVYHTKSAWLNLMSDEVIVQGYMFHPWV